LLGVRALTAREARAVFLFWRGVGREWGVDIPEEQQEFRAWFHAYERRTYRRTEDGIAIARSAGDAPEIDGVVRIAASALTRPGEFIEVEIVGADRYDLQGRLAI